jgi:pimeloyl-ACP methyl ester carboxylesterase
VIAVSSALPSQHSSRPPIVLIHGAANSASIWIYWQQGLAAAGWPSHAIDLRGHGRSDTDDLSNTSMADYAADVRLLLSQLPGRPVVMGWSLGGLVALMAAAEGGVSACVALAPSAPARAREAQAQLRSGVFGPEEYGLTRDGVINQRAMPDLDADEQAIAIASLCADSRYARDDRQAGIVIERLPCPLLIATGTADRQWPLSRYEDLWLSADYCSADGSSHWGLVLNRRALAALVPAVASWLTSHVA